jgi:hypothetical protein
VRWADFAHAVRAAAGILAEREVVVIGSQAILATFKEEELPAAALASMEIDITVFDDPDGTKSDILSGAIGEWSPFHESFGFYVDGVSMTTPDAPRGWQSRLVRVQTPAMNGAAALAMEPHDLCVAKLFAHREKDLTFVAALIAARLVDPTIIRERALLVDASPATTEKVLAWLDAVAPIT